MIRRTMLAAVAVLGAVGGATVVAAQAAAAVTPGVTITATAPQRPIPSGIAGVGYYAAFSNLTAVNTGAAASPATTLQVQVPTQTNTASFAVTPDAKRGKCRLKVKGVTQTWTCKVPALAAGTSADIATVVGSESYNTGLPTTVDVTAIGPDGTVVPLVWQWVIPYSHLTATWSNLPTSVDWGAPAGATLTVHNDGIWPSASPTVAVRPTDPTQFSQAWTGSSSVSGYFPYYCGWDTSSGSPDGLACTLDPIAPGGSQTITVTAYPVAPAGGPLTLTATDSSGNFDLTSPSVALVGTGADLTLSVSNPPSVEAGTVFPRTYTITNTGSTEALDVRVTDQSPVFPVGTTSGPGTCAYFSAYRVGGRINCSFGTIPANSSVTLVAQLGAPSGAGSFTYGTYGSTSSATVPGGLNLSTSSHVSVFVNPAVDVTPPTLTGVPQVGQTLTATWGTWSGTGTISLWAKLCHSGGVGCSSDITSTYTNGSTTTGTPSSIAFTYLIPPGDAGGDLVLYVSATNNGGQTILTTAALGPVSP
jgi:hypothetical protein